MILIYLLSTIDNASINVTTIVCCIITQKLLRGKEHEDLRKSMFWWFL